MTTAGSHPEPLALAETDRKQVADILTGLRDVLGDELIGAYLQGSAVLGGLRALSDIDVLAVSTRQMTRNEKERMVGHLLAVSGTYPSAVPPRPVELTIVVWSEIRPWRYPPRMDFQYGEWWRDRFQGGQLEPWPSITNPDLALLVTIALLGGATLAGPPPSEVFDPVPRADFLDALVADMGAVVQDIEWDTVPVSGNSFSHSSTRVIREWRKTLPGTCMSPRGLRMVDRSELARPRETSSRSLRTSGLRAGRFGQLSPNTLPWER
jgi:predicted nucleotidyltransferase